MTTPPGVQIGPLVEEDLAELPTLAWRAFEMRPPVGPGEPALTFERRRALARHTMVTDPEGSWAARRDGRLIGVSQAIVREGIWGLALLIVEPEEQGRGVGRALIERALAYSAGTRGALICSSSDPRALRRYHLAGFALEPAMRAAGIVDRAALPAPDPHVIVIGRERVEETAAISRAVRGASHAVDLAVEFGWPGEQLLLYPGRGFALATVGAVRLLAALDEVAAQALLWRALADSDPGREMEVGDLTARQGWAIGPLVQAGMRIELGGAVCVRGEAGPLTPYLPSGAFL